MDMEDERREDGTVAVADELFGAVAPQMDVENKLGKLPEVLYVMAHLNLVVAQSTDFSLLLEGGAKPVHIRNPNSFRATVVQISNDMYDAFRAADTAMTTLQLATSPRQLPSYIVKVVELLKAGSVNEIKVKLPKLLKRIQDKVNLCIGKTKEVVVGFDKAEATLKEVTELTTAAEGQTKKDLDKAKLKITIEGDTLEYVAEELAAAQEDEREKKVKLEEEEVKYQDRVEQLTSLWHTAHVAMGGVADAMIKDVLPTAGKALSIGLVAKSMTNVETVAWAGATVLSGTNKETVLDYLSSQKKGSKAEKKVDPAVIQEYQDTDVSRIITRLTILSEMSDEAIFIKDETAKLDNDKLRDETFFSTIPDECKTHHDNLNKIETNRKYYNLDEVLGLCTNLQKCVEKTKELHDKKELEGKAVANLKDDFKNLIKKARFIRKLASAKQSDDKEQESEQTADVKQTAYVSVAKTVVESQQSSLNHMRDQYEKRKEELEKLKLRKLELSKTSLEAIAKLEEHKAASASAKDTLKVIQHGLKALGEVRQSWVGLLKYFELLRDILENELKDKMEYLADESESVQELMRDDGKKTDQTELQQSAQAAMGVTKLLCYYSRNYCQISDRYMMPLVASFGSLLAVRGDEGTFDTKKQELKKLVEEIQKKIMELIEENHATFLRQIPQSGSSVQAQISEITDST